MYKILIKVYSGSKGNSLKTLIKHKFIPIYYNKKDNYEYYLVLYNGSLTDLKESLADLAYSLSLEGKSGGRDYATIYEVNDKYVGKLLGSGVGSLLGYSLLGTGGLIIGLLSGLLLGEIIDLELGEKFIGVMEWPTSVRI